MKRPLLTVGVSFFAGTFLALFFGLDGLLPSLPLLAAGVAAYFLLPRPKTNVAAAVALLCLSLAFGCTGQYRRRNLAPLLALQGQYVTARGVITEETHTSSSFTLTLRAAFPGQGLPGAALKVKGYGEPEYSAGDILECRLLLGPLLGSPGYWNSRGVFLQGRMTQGGIVPYPTPAERLRGGLIRLRMTMKNNLLRALPPDTGPLLCAMLLGERDELSEEAKLAFGRAGTVHLLSVSGLHLSVLVGFVGALLERARLGRRLRALLCGGAAAFMAALVGFSPSVTRALVMLLVTLAARAFSRRGDTLNSLGLALLLLSLFAPYWTLGSGLWLSASSTAGIAVLRAPLLRRMTAFFFAAGASAAAPPVAGTRRRVLSRAFWLDLFLGGAAAGVSAFAFSLPVMLVSIGWISLVSPLANVLIAPLTAPALLAGIGCAVLPAAPGWLAWPAHHAARLMLAVSRLLAGLPGATFAMDELWLLIWFLLLGATAAVLLRCRPVSGALLRYACLLLVFAFSMGNVTLAAAGRGTVELVTLEGCETVLLLRDDSAVALGAPSIYEIGNVSRYLRFRGVKKLDALVAYNCGETPGSGLKRITDEFDPGIILGPDDAYILGQMELLLGRETLSCGYADITVLDAVTLRLDRATGELAIRVGERLAVKSPEEYREMETPDLRVWAEGVTAWRDDTPPSFEPVGGALFGECRIVLPV